RRVPRKILEVANHMHLVVIVEPMSDVDPGSLWRCDLDVQRCLKPGDTGVNLRAATRFRQETALKLALAESCLTCNFCYTDHAAHREYSVGGADESSWVPGTR